MTTLYDAIKKLRDEGDHTDWCDESQVDEEDGSPMSCACGYFDVIGAMPDAPSTDIHKVSDDDAEDALHWKLHAETSRADAAEAERDAERQRADAAEKTSAAFEKEWLAALDQRNEMVYQRDRRLAELEAAAAVVVLLRRDQSKRSQMHDAITHLGELLAAPASPSTADRMRRHCCHVDDCGCEDVSLDTHNGDKK